MEQQLVEAIDKGEVDEIAAAMIKARLKAAGKALDDVVHKAADEIHEVFLKYPDEFRLLGSTIVMYYKDRLFDIDNPNDFEVELIDGHGKFVEQAKQKLNAVETRR